jgi:hypothetical protein
MQRMGFSFTAVDRVGNRDLLNKSSFQAKDYAEFIKPSRRG